MPADLYGTLGLKPNASQNDIRRAYFRLARKYHPDLHPGDAVAEERMEGINLAYETLSDADKRKEYDILIGIRVATATAAEPAPGTEGAQEWPVGLGDRSPYQVLGLSSEAEQWVIRESFGVLAEKYMRWVGSHPAARLAFRQLKLAYDMLSTYEKRCRYHEEHGLRPPPPEGVQRGGFFSDLDNALPHWPVALPSLCALAFGLALALAFGTDLFGGRPDPLIP